MTKSDNTIPGAILQHMARTSTIASDWLRYEDWIATQPGSGRVTIGAAEHEHGDDSPFTLSCLMPNDTSLRAIALASPEWDLDQSQILRAVLDRGLGNDPEENDISAIPFTFNRSFVDRKSELDIVQAFALHHAAYRDGNELRFVDGDGNRHTLAWFSLVNGVELIEADEHLLRSFLRDLKAALIRYHDHHRFDSNRGGSETCDELPHVTATANYRVIHVTEAERGMGLLRGKDIVEPYASAPAAREDHLAFIIGLSDGGETIEVTCDPDRLSNLFTDRGTVNFLTDTFFHRSVLDRYYDDASDFSVESNTVARNGIWSIPYAVTDDGLVHVHLGDLARLPIEHQHHWRAYNVVSHGGIPEDRFRRDFLAEWTESSDPIAGLKQALSQLQDATSQKYGEPVIRDLKAEDAHFLASLRVPATDDWREFDTQLLNITKPTSDSINVKLLRELVPYVGEGDDKRTPIGLFEAWLRSLGVGEGDVVASAAALRSAQTLRSESSAHRKGSDLEKTIRKLGFGDLQRSRIIQGLAQGIHSALSTAIGAI
ncbi:MAG: hypothetical protein ACYDCA_01365 [Candidatus Tyrphobacter sp.]